MIQEYLVRAIDEMSYFYMGFQKSTVKPAAAMGSLEEYIRREGASDPVSFFKNPGHVPKIAFYDPVKRRRYNILKFKFESPVYSLYKANKTVYGRYYERHGEPDAPLLVLLHGWRMDSYMLFDKFARLFIHEGFNVAMPDLPYHMKRTPGGSFAGEHTFKDDAIHTMATFRQAIFDIMSIINWSNEKRSSRAIAVMGVSFGALLTGLLTCLEPSVDLSVMVAPPVDLGAMFASSRLGRIFEKENPRGERMLRLYKETLNKVALQNLKPLLPPERIFIAEGRFDGMVPPELIENLWHAWGHPCIRRYDHGHLSVIMLNADLDEDILEWLHGFKDYKYNSYSVV